MEPGNGDKAQVLDFTLCPTAQKLVSRCQEFFAEVQDLSVHCHVVILVL